MKTLSDELKPHWRVVRTVNDPNRDHIWICSECGAQSPVDENGNGILTPNCKKCGADFRIDGGVRI